MATVRSHIYVSFLIVPTNIRLVQALGQVAMEAFDWQGNIPQEKTTSISLNRINQLIGCQIDKLDVISILKDVDIQILSDNGDNLEIQIPENQVFVIHRK